MRGLDYTLAALAEPTRRRVVELLREGPRRAGELAEAMKVSFPLMSRHLRTLRMSGLVEEKHSDLGDSRIRVYGLRREPFEELQAWLKQVQAFWTDQREHIERGKGKRR
jgi:DNA-binding transcriptional ArsR family regulator